jgi:hypothetical protein
MASLSRSTEARVSQDIDEVDEIEEEWDEVLIEMRRFAVEQAIALRAGPSETMDQIFERADHIIDYITSGRR